MTRARLLSMCFGVTCAWMIGASSAWAQTAAGEITGLTKDQAGAAVPGASIAVTNTQTNFQRVAVSTGEGIYTAASLVPGQYRLEVELAGFKPVRREGVGLETGEKTRYDTSTTVFVVTSRVTEEQLKLGSTLTEGVANPNVGIIPRSVSNLGDPLIPRAQLLKPYPESTSSATTGTTSARRTIKAFHSAFDNARHVGSGTRRLTPAPN